MSAFTTPFSFSESTPISARPPLLTPDPFLYELYIKKPNSLSAHSTDLYLTCYFQSRDPSLSFYCHAAATSHPSPWQPEPLGPMRKGMGWVD